MIGTVIGGIVVVALVLMFWRVQQGARTHDPGADAAEPRVTIALRLVGEDEDVADALASNYGEAGCDFTAETLDPLLRLTSLATHFYAGPYVSELRSDLPGGILLKFDVHYPQGRTRDRPGDIASVQAWLGDLTPAPASLNCVPSSKSGQPMLARVDEDRPELPEDHRRCECCGESFLFAELTCPNCGSKEPGALP